MKTAFYLFFGIFLFSQNFFANAQDPHSYIDVKGNTWIKVYNYPDLNSSQVVFTNRYGDEEIHLFRDSIVAFKINKMCFVSIAINNRLVVDVPCFVGDTVSVDLTKKKYSYNKRNLTSYDTSFYSIFRTKYRPIYEEIEKLRMRAFDKSSSTLYVMKKDVPTQLTDSLSSLYKLMNNLQGRELDSLNQLNKFTEDIYLSFKSLIASEKIQQSIQLLRMSKDNKFVELLDKSIVRNTHFINDGTNSYKPAILNFIDAIIGKGDYKKISQNEISINYRDVYTSLNNYFDSGLLDFAKYRCLIKIKRIEKKQVFDSLYEKYKNQVNDPATTAYIAKRFAPVNITKHTNKDILEDIKGKQLSFKEFVNNNHGKMIYIDFWASNCLPCLKTIKQTRMDIQKLDTNQVVYVYMSLDEDKYEWQNTMVKYELSDYKYNFRMLRLEKNYLINQIELKLIPRYILINGEGKISMSDAPAPDTNTFKALIQSFQNQK